MRNLTNLTSLNKITINIFLFLTVLLSNSSILANSSSNYQIELIIFKNNKVDEIYKEHWPKQQALLTKPENAFNLIKAPELSEITEQNKLPDELVSSENNYVLLSKDKLKQTGIYNKLKNSRRYTTISHIGWQQPKRSLKNSQPIYFQLGKEFNNTPELAGIIKFSVKKFVHAKIDLLLEQPVQITNPATNQFVLVNNTDKSDANLQGFLLSEERRLKNNELNYFDHPAFSAIMVVSEV
ncbi:MAG: hypothetical protein KBD64_01910 [Gammaproteobacteria bacterium]|nr:hypothetical protein [Gammaproteobacteria bacterium]